MPPHGWAPQHLAVSAGSGRFRALSVGELLDAVFSLYRRNFLLIAAISAAVQVPYALVQYLLYQLSGFSDLQGRLQNATQNLQNQPPTQDQIQNILNIAGNVLLISGILALVSVFLVLPLAEAATTRAVSDRYLDRPASIGSSYAAALRRLGPLIVQSLILAFGFAVAVAAAVLLTIGLAAALGGGAVALAAVLFIALAVLAIFVYVRTSLAAPAIVLENLSGWQGLVRSWNLVRGLFWRMLGIRLLLLLITVIISGILVALLGLAGSALDTNGNFILQQVAGAVAAVFVSPITYIAVTLLYYDARIRKEAFDIEMLAQTL